jgi:hypothetical protein
MQISVKHNIGALRVMLEGQSKQVRFATVVALTRTALDVKKGEVDEMRKVFDRPTDYALRGITSKGATTANLQAEVWIRDDRSSSAIPADRFLSPNVTGGERHTKRFEKALQALGFMANGDRAVPGRFAKLDAYGNVSKGQIVQIITQLRAGGSAAKGNAKALKKMMAARRRAGGQYFALPKGRGKLLPGIYQRADFSFGSAAPRPVFIFVNSSTYKTIWRFHEIGQQVVERRFNENFDQAYEEALRTARP